MECYLLWEDEVDLVSRVKVACPFLFYTCTEGESMNYYTLPQALYELDGIRKIVSDDENCILYKDLDKNMPLSV